MTSTAAKKISNTSDVMKWMQPIGEIMFMKKPSQTLGVIIKTDR